MQRNVNACRFIPDRVNTHDSAAIMAAKKELFPCNLERSPAKNTGLHADVVMNDSPDRNSPQRNQQDPQ
jgi:hypothetical protein